MIRDSIDVIAKDFLKSSMLNLTNCHCSYCGKEISRKSMHIDHVIPISRGGVNSIDNLVPSCRSCNLSKGTMTLNNFRKVIWFRNKFNPENNFTPSQIIELIDLGLFDNIPEERNHEGYKFFLPKLNNCLSPF